MLLVTWNVLALALICGSRPSGSTAIAMRTDEDEGAMGCVASEEMFFEHDTRNTESKKTAKAAEYTLFIMQQGYIKRQISEKDCLTNIPYFTNN